MNKLHFCLLGLFVSSVVLQAQTINLEFPYFAGKTYEFKIVQGENQVMLKNDTIPKGGKVQLTIPEKYRGYKGMSMWYLTNSETGGGLEMVINNEDFSVSCLDAVPTNQSIVYKNTQENIFANTNYQEQQAIFAKHDAMMYAKRAYSKTHELYPVFEKEYNAIKADYATFVNKLKATNLYAARFRELTNLTMGIGSIITEDEKLKAENINDIMVNQLKYEDLYTSNHWGGIINSYVQLQTMVFKNDDRLIADTKTILKRLPSNQIYTDYVVNLTKELTKSGKDHVIAALTKEIKSANKLQHYNGVLNIYKKDITGKAPDLIIMEHIGDPALHNHVNTLLETSKLNSKHTLVVFYLSGCGPCEETLNSLKANYKDLTQKGVRIISLAADTDEAVFKNTSFQFPWADKFCNLDGMNGENFKNYAVIGTPTLFLLDKKGNITHKMSGMTELKKIFSLK